MMTNREQLLQSWAAFSAEIEAWLKKTNADWPPDKFFLKGYKDKLDDGLKLVSKAGLYHTAVVIAFVAWFRKEYVIAGKDVPSTPVPTASPLVPVFVKNQVIEVSTDGKDWVCRVFVKTREDGQFLCRYDRNFGIQHMIKYEQADLVPWPFAREVQ